MINSELEREQHQEELDHMTNQIDSYPHAAIGHLVEHHLGDVMRALVQEIESMTSDMGYYFDNKQACDAFEVAANALKMGLDKDNH